jgi:transposase InsO family protein/transposase-like protein
LVMEEWRLKDERLARVPAHERPHFPPVERLAILELRAARGWSLRQAAERFHLSPSTLSMWMHRLDEEGSDALVRSMVPLNKYPDVVAYAVQRLKVLCPTFGYGRIAHVLGREGLRLGTSTVQRMMRRVVAPQPAPEPDRAKRTNRMKRVIARHPHHAWHCDLTTVPTSMGFWAPALPFGIAQRWPFCWWLVVLADQFSARILRLAILRNQPTPGEVQDVLAQAVDESGVFPEYLITDKGAQFRNRLLRGWCKRTGIRHRFGALGQFGSIPFIERLILTIKKECTTRFLFPFSHSAARNELTLFAAWYNRVRPHERLSGATPDEIHDRVEPIWQRALVQHDDRGGARLALQVRYLEGRKHLPIITLDRAA